jgi:proline iminopeptidase
VPRDIPVGWREQVADLEAMRAALNVERLTLCGYSWGGLLAVLYYLEHPERLERLALVAPASPTSQFRSQFEWAFAERSNAPEIVRARDELRTSGLRERDPEGYRRRAFELSVAGYFRDPRDAERLTPFRVTARTQEAVWASLGEYDLRARLRDTVSRLSSPVSQILHGSYDPLPIAGSRELASIMKAELIELPTGHCPHVEATEAFVQALDRFLPRQPA